MRKHFSDCQGTTIIEMLVYLVISLVILNMGMVTFLRTGRIAAAASQGLLYTQSEQRFAEDCTRILRSANTVVERLDTFETDASQVIVKTSDGYSAIGMPGGVLAIWEITQEGDTYGIGRMRTFPSSYATMAFIYDAGPPNTRCVTVRLTPKGDPADERKMRDIVVALRAGSNGI